MGKIANWVLLLGLAHATTKFNVESKIDENDGIWPWDTGCPALTESGQIIISKDS